MDPQSSPRTDLAPARNPFARFALWSVVAVWAAAIGWEVYRYGFRTAWSHAMHHLAFLLLAAVVLLLIYGAYRLILPRR